LERFGEMLPSCAPHPMVAGRAAGVKGKRGGALTGTAGRGKMGRCGWLRERDG
jgi:hypothetical protein